MNELKLKSRKEVDLHMHSNFSDGDCSVKELIRRIKETGLKAAVLTDHDTIGGTGNFLDICEMENIDTLTGIEISAYCDFLKEEIHILGYGFNYCQLRDNYNQLLFRNCSIRRKNIWKILDLYEENGEWNIYSHNLESMFHLPVNISSMYWLHKARSLHIMKLEGLDFLSAYEKAKKETQKGAKFYYPNENNYAPVKEAIGAIRRTGGIAVWAHPAETIKRLKKKIKGENAAKRLFEDALKFFVYNGLGGLEVYSAVDETEAGIDSLLQCASKYGLFISGGSDYHGDKEDEHKPDRWLGKNGISYEVFCKLKSEIIKH